MWSFLVVVLQRTAKKCTKMHVSENRPHLLLLAVILVGQACLQYCNLHVLDK